MTTSERTQDNEPTRKRSAPEAIDDDDDHDLVRSEIPDVDYRLIGLSPQYWSYAPLSIGDLIGLPLVNGVDCFVGRGVDVDVDGGGAVRDDGKNENGKTTNEDANRRRRRRRTTRVLPLSRVLLRGVASAVDRRPNGCTLIVLDDGTGSIDCRHWDDGDDDAFDLSLSPEREGANRWTGRRSCGRRSRFVAGDSLEVMGKIKALTAGRVVVAKKKNDEEECEPLPSNGSSSAMRDRTPEVRFGCVREVHASSVCLMGDNAGPTTRIVRADNNRWNGEIVHWLKCVEFSRRATTAAAAGENGRDRAIRNGKDVLPLLGEKISSSLLGDDVSVVDDATGEDGGGIPRGRCCRTPRRFQTFLSYCHCESTLESLDASFRFRDALLHRLLDAEARLTRSSESPYPSATEDCMDLCGVSDPTAAPPPLLFAFESVYEDGELLSVAREAVASTASPEANARRLVRKTFAAMANDGILSLYDAEKDLYLLVSRARVIEPFLRRSNSISQPFFIKSVPRKRIAQVKARIDGEGGI